MIRLIVPTADGTNTLYVPHLNEHYHSTYGANEESKHIYISQAYVHSPNPSPTVLEIGFGTGLNAMNTCIEALTQQRKTTYI
ncbi:MAG TPA: SAM-dependent methyltransferase, partial [Bacteroidales bacterium]|nr:SAM-dependent methyltransferase [Bacteroidales bacterium]